MAPPKIACFLPGVNIINQRKGITTRSQVQNQNLNLNQNHKTTDLQVCRGKRKAETSPGKEQMAKRSAFGDITNDVNNAQVVNQNKKGAAKAKTAQTKIITTLKNVAKLNTNHAGVRTENMPTVKVTRASIQDPSVVSTTAVKPKETNKAEQVKLNIRRITNEFEKTEDSLYISAVEDMSNESSSKYVTVMDESKLAKSVRQPSRLSVLRAGLVPPGVHDYDKENWNDVFQVSEYAMDIFQYLKDRENSFSMIDYMAKQNWISRWMRSLLVDWMVEVQESFELNHETLYLAVKLVDLYLCKITVTKDKLQLLGASALFIAAKFDERIPPLVEDFLYICDGAYQQREFLRMEMSILKVVDFNLGIPLSYRFLRRFARCTKVNMPTLTLARYILEFSLMDYDTIMIPDSKMAAAALYLALKMKKVSDWTNVLEFYTSYTEREIYTTACHLNSGLHKKPKEALSTVRNKYSHKIFFEVARTPLLTNEQLAQSLAQQQQQQQQQLAQSTGNNTSSTTTAAVSNQ